MQAIAILLVCVLVPLQVGKQFLVDASHEEEACAECRLTMAVNRAGQLCGVVKEGEGTIPWEQYLKAVKVRMYIHARISLLLH